MVLTAAQIAEALGGARGHGDQWSARCPAHDDRNPSLSITQDGDQVLVRCHGGCDQAAVVAELKARQLWSAAQRQERTGRGMTISEVYRYRNPEGVEVFQVVRLEPKSFRQRMPDEKTWKVPKELREHTIFHLPSILKAIEVGSPVWVVEGEKDVEALNRLALQATCNPGGAGKWGPGHAAHLVGADRVVVVADADGPGRAHAHQVARSLHGLVGGIRIIECPGSKDAAEWIGRGATRQDFERVANEAPDWSTATPEPEAPKPDQAADAAHVGDLDLELTEAANARRFLFEHGQDVRYVPAWGKWLTWDGRAWNEDEVEVPRRALASAAGWRDQVLAQGLGDGPGEAKRVRSWAERSLGKSSIQSTLWIAGLAAGIALRPGDLDRDPFALTVANGTVDLRTAELRPHRREDLVTRAIPVEYQPQATAPRWGEFLREVTGGDGDLETYLQRAVGYSLTGSVREQCFFFLHGSGANGKSTLLEVVREILGGYSRQMPADALAVKRWGGGGASPEVARLKGARLATAVETSQGMRLDEAMVKQLTGGDTVTARYLHANPFEFQPTHKLWIAANHKPEIRGDDDGIWRRVHLVPFEVTIPEERRDPELPRALRAELPGILNWAILGAEIWHNIGLRPPERVLAATQEYRSEMDLMGQFLEERTFLDLAAEAPARELYRTYTKWCDEVGRHAQSEQAFGRAMASRGFERRHGHYGKRYIGLGILADAQDGQAGSGHQEDRPRGPD